MFTLMLAKGKLTLGEARAVHEKGCSYDCR